MPCKHHHFGGITTAPETPEGRHPSEAWHLEVEEHHIEILPGQDLQGLFPALCGDDYASSLGEFPLHQDPGRLFVIDDEHLNRMFQTQDLSPPTPVATGSRIVTVVPLPSPSLLTSIDPPCCSIIP